MDEPRSIVDIVEARAAAAPQSLAYGFLASGEHEASRLTWGELDGRVWRLSSVIGSHAQPGARVLLLFPPGLDFIPAFFGCLRAGAIAVPAYPPSARRSDRGSMRLRGIVKDAAVSLVVAPSCVKSRRAAIERAVPEMRGLPWLPEDESELLESAASEPQEPSTGREVALLQYTSGSTSTPRGVVVTHRNLLHNLACGAQFGAYDEASVGVSWLPVNHDMGLIGGVLQPAFSGFPMWLMAPAAFLQRPVRWLQAISRLGASHSPAPNFAYELCARRVTECDRRTLDLSTWRVACNGSEPVRAATLEAFQRAFGECGFRWEAFRPAYGLAESTLFVSGVAVDDGPVMVDLDRGAIGRNEVLEPVDGAESVTLVASGAVPEGVQILTVDPLAHAPVAPGQIGEIWIASDSIAAGYWNRPEESAATFGAFLATGEGPFLRTGDLGFLRGRSLFVTGRMKDVLIVRGVNHYPHDLELTAERASLAIRPGCCAAFCTQTTGGAEEVVLAAELNPRSMGAEASSFDEVISAVRREINRAHGLHVSSVVLVAPGSLPRTTSGKLQRFACRDAFLAGDLDVLSHSNAPGLPSRLGLRRAS
jgi:acyl-CoA synthetase (AMP-forming)/AMP-acid ligase II